MKAHIWEFMFSIFSLIIVTPFVICSYMRIGNVRNKAVDGFSWQEIQGKIGCLLIGGLAMQ